MLHVRACVLCERSNHFFDESIPDVDEDQQKSCADRLIELCRKDVNNLVAESLQEKSKNVGLDARFQLEQMYREAEEDEEDEEDSEEDLQKKAYEMETAASTTVEATETAQGEDEEKNDDEEEKFETRWRCWKCRKIFKMDQQCPTHLVNLGDYEEYDFDTLLVEVKVES